MLSWDDYDKNAEESAVVNDATLQKLENVETKAQPEPEAQAEAPTAPAAPRKGGSMSPAEKAVRRIDHVGCAKNGSRK